MCWGLSNVKNLTPKSAKALVLIEFLDRHNIESILEKVLGFQFSLVKILGVDHFKSNLNLIKRPKLCY